MRPQVAEEGVCAERVADELGEPTPQVLGWPQVSRAAAVCPDDIVDELEGSGPRPALDEETTAPRWPWTTSIGSNRLAGDLEESWEKGWREDGSPRSKEEADVVDEELVLVSECEPDRMRPEDDVENGKGGCGAPREA